MISTPDHAPEPAQHAVHGPMRPGYGEILTPEALAFVAGLARRFGHRVPELLAARGGRQAEFDAGARPDFLAETRSIRASEWTVAPLPEDLRDRRVEITGPVDRKMIINALNSGASVFMADFEDATAPTWDNMVQGQINLRDAVAGSITHVGSEGKVYRLGARPAVLMVRPRGWHLPEKHFQVDGSPVPGALFDFGLFFFHNARTLLARGSGPYFYLPKLESHLEARLWNEIFLYAQECLGLPAGTIKATVLIETLPAAFEMEEILWELRPHAAGLNCGRWDYIFSFMKVFRNHADRVLPDRAQVTMEQPFMRAYTRLLVRTCHRRGAAAMGGMAAQIPIRDDPAASERALARVRADKLREVTDGHDGTWVAHPGLVPVAREVFDAHMPGPNQMTRLPDVSPSADDLCRLPEGTRTEEGLRLNVRVGIQYLEAWLRGQGCVPLYNLMEDAATAEISRTQVWQWVRHRAALADGRAVTPRLFASVVDEEMALLRGSLGPQRFAEGRFEEARDLFMRLALAPVCDDFLTLHAYERLVALDGTLNGCPRPGCAAPEVDGCTARRIGRDAPCAGRWAGIVRPYGDEDVERLRGSVRISHTLAERGARRLWELLHDEPYVAALGALTGNQAMQQVRAGLKAIYLSGWQVAADANLAGQMYPDQSLYPCNSVPMVVQRINRALQRADQIERAEGRVTRDWYAPIVADAEAGFGGPLHAFELMKAMIEAGASGVHFEDQLAAAKKCGHLGGKVLVPVEDFIRILVAARLAADVMDVPTVLVARTDARSAELLTSDQCPLDAPYLTGERTLEGFFRVRGGLEFAITRALAYAPHADVLWCETSTPDLAEARRFAEAVHSEHPGKLLAYNCSPSFNWKTHLDEATIARFQRELGAMGYKFQFVTLAGFHALNHSMFRLARGYLKRGMAAYARLQQAEFADAEEGYSAVKHQREVGTGYFDEVSKVIHGGNASTLALEGSTEAHQF